jgi:hypothetical protein
MSSLEREAKLSVVFRMIPEWPLLARGLFETFLFLLIMHIFCLIIYGLFSIPVLIDTRLQKMELVLS